MAITKKDWEGMASVINNAIKSNKDMLTALGEHFADKFPRFNMDKWLEACLKEVPLDRAPTAADVGKKVRMLNSSDDDYWELGEEGVIDTYDYGDYTFNIYFPNQDDYWWAAADDMVLIE